MKAPPALVGCSLDSNLFTGSWIGSALSYILSRHPGVLFLIADDLLHYTRSQRMRRAAAKVDFGASSLIIRRRSDEFERTLAASAGRLAEIDKSRVEVKRWREFADASFVELYRRMLIACWTVRPFRECVESMAREHIFRRTDQDKILGVVGASTTYVLEEVAMCLRVTEVAGYSHEYYPAPEARVLTELYSGRFDQYGLSVRDLVGKDPARQFTVLPPW